ncbi:LysR family transcriptional regulator [Thalassiella azotivora]
MAVELRELRALVAVADEGTFTDAAIALGTSQASVSRAVAGLEDELGVRLLLRTSRGATPTVTGQRVLAHARRVLDDVAAVHRVVAGTGELRVGYAWAALGRHTTAVQRRWSADHPGASVVFVQSATVSAGLVEGVADVAVLRRPVEDRRLREALETVLVGVERRYAVLASDHRLGRRRTLGLRDLLGEVVGVDSRTGSTTPDLWPEGTAPAAVRETRGVDELLNLIAAGAVVGITSEATVRQHPRPGIVYRPVRDAEPVAVHLAWWRDDPPPRVRELVGLVCELYAADDPR